MKWLLGILRRRRIERELREEMDFHVQMRTDLNRASGMAGDGRAEAIRQYDPAAGRNPKL